MTVRRIFLQNLVGPTAAAYRRIMRSPSASSSKIPAPTAPTGTGTGTSAVRRTRFRPSTQLKSSPGYGSRTASAPLPRRIRIKRVSSSPSSSAAAPVAAAARPSVPKLPPAGPSLLPRPLRSVPNNGGGGAAGGVAGGVGGGGAAGAGGAAAGATTSAEGASAKFAYSANTQRILTYLRLNGPILLLNFGSLCTLAGFTRTDVLELRIGNLIGNTCGMTYFLFNRLMPPFTWASVFGMTNAYNIYRILEERSDRVILSREEQMLYEEHFLHHGVTPR
mmetsp:Transcript_11466/g.24180  ORF Transcript_11466/g.24180 Transcript_11466/m.24180 type:complete len:277 (+) Transcript_11466:372-1202(+)